jgi:hypothetical protein
MLFIRDKIVKYIDQEDFLSSLFNKIGEEEGRTGSA